MNLLLHFYPGDAVIFFLVKLVVQIAMVVCLAIVISRVVPRNKAVAQHVIWSCCLVLILILPALNFCIGYLNISLVSIDLPQTTHVSLQEVGPNKQKSLVLPSLTSYTREPPIEVNDREIKNEYSADPSATKRLQTPDRNPRVGFRADLYRGLAVIVLAAWGAGIVYQLVRVIVGYWAMHRLWLDGESLDVDKLEGIYSRVRNALTADTLPVVMTSPNVRGPIVAGLFKPKVLIPQDLSLNLHHSQLFEILVHECAHIVRGDHWVVLLQKIAEALYWHHPLVYCANRKLAKAREEVCDNYVLQNCNAASFSETLLDLTNRYFPIGSGKDSLAITGRRSNLESRIGGIVDERRNLATRLRWTENSVVAAVFIIIGTTVSGFGIRVPEVKASPLEDSQVENETDLIHLAEEPSFQRNSKQQTIHSGYMEDSLPDGTILRLGTTRLRQRQGVEGVAFSHDGKNLVSTGWGDSIRFWDVHTGRQVRRLKVAERDGTFAVAFSPDGLKLASVSENGFVRLWDLDSGEVLFKVPGHKGRTYGVAFAPDGLTFATAGADASVRVWDVASGIELLELKCDTSGGDAHPVAYSPDGKFLASGSSKGKIRIWNLNEGGEPIVLVKAHGREVTSLSFTKDGNALISSGFRYERRAEKSSLTVSEIHVWDVASGLQLDGFDTDEELLGNCTLALSLDGNILVTSHYEKIVKWDVKTRRPIQVIHGDLVHYSGRTHGLAISPDSKLIASKAEDHKVYLWNIETGEPVLLQGETHTGGVLSVQYSPDGSKIVTGSEDAAVRIWEANSGKPIRTISKGSGWVRYVEFFPDGKRIAMGAETHARDKPGFAGEVKICRVANGEIIHHFPINDKVMCGAMSRDGNLIGVATGLDYYGFGDKEPVPITIHIWETESGNKLSELIGHEGKVRRISFSANSEFLWSSSVDQTIRKWNVHTGKQLMQIDLSSKDKPRAFQRVVINPNATLAIHGGLQEVDPETYFGTLRMLTFDKSEQQWEKTISNWWPSVMVISPDGRVIATYLSATWRSQVDNRITLWSADQGKELRTFEIEDGHVRSLAFSPDGTRLVSGMDRGDALIWDVSASQYNRK